MTSKPLLSIIIPTYNSAKTLSISLDSLKSQTFRDFEVLIVDGVSKDDTLAIAASYTLSLPSIHIFSEPDKGIYDAMNKGIGKAKGEWVYFLGSDDSLATSTVLEDIFGKKRETVAQHDFVYGNVFWGHSSEIYMGIFDEYIMYRSNICHQAIFYRKTIFELLGHFDLAYPALADWKLNMHCFLDKRVRIAYVPHMIAYFAIDGSSKDFIDHFKKDKETFYKQLLKQHSASEQTLKAMILFEQRPLQKKWLALKYKWLRLRRK